MHLQRALHPCARQVYGQGISVAAIEAETLRKLLEVRTVSHYH